MDKNIEERSLSQTLTFYKNSLVITAPRYLRFFSKGDQPNILAVVKEANLEESDRIADLIIQNRPDCVISFGSGKTIDIAKYSAAKTNSYFVAVPACLSTNCFFTNKSTLFDKGIKRTLDSKIPNKVVFDWGAISRNRLMNTCGLIELLSSSSALSDWSIANDEDREKIDRAIYLEAEKIVSSTEKLLNNKTINLRRQSELLRLSGELVVRYGSGRAVSGSEHILSSVVESYYRCPHGIALFASILIAIRLQQSINYSLSCNDLVRMLLKKEQLKKYIKKSMKRDVLLKLFSGAKPRPDRYTVLDKIDKQKLTEICPKTINDIFK